MSKGFKYLNIGCGKRFHKSWVNIDVLPADPGVIHCDVTKGLPFDDQSMDVIYHAHVLEHIPKDRAHSFMAECYRVLKPDGIIRVVVPDLEQIVRNYLYYLESNLKKPTEESVANYNWMMLELYDQVVRNSSGGQMEQYLKSNPVNTDFVLSRLGEEVRPLLEGSRKKLRGKEKLKKFLRLSNSAKFFFVKSVFNSVLHRFLPGNKYYKIGKFRSEGEIHQWMYDQYSLKVLMKEVGFKHVEVCTATKSAIPDWTSFKLDSDGERVYKPDSLFMEGKKDHPVAQVSRVTDTVGRTRQG